MTLGLDVGQFAFQNGDWRVKHQKLRHRLVGSDEWLEFDGTCRAWELLGGAGNVDDHFLNDPAGAYRATTVRCRNPIKGEWMIWWFDGRSPALGAPVRGQFSRGLGMFVGDDIFAGRPIRMRFIWSDISSNRPHWEQAFSVDEGESWETNWLMHFSRDS